MANDKEIIKKLASIVSKQQKIIEKLAQFAPTGLPGDPLDPTLPGNAPTSMPQPGAHPSASKEKSAPDTKAGGLPGDLKSALDAKAPNLKGSLLVTVNGKSLNIAFNADRVKDRPSDLKNKLNSALSDAGYSVTDIIGHMNPAWKANY